MMILYQIICSAYPSSINKKELVYCSQNAKRNPTPHLVSFMKKIIAVHIKPEYSRFLSIKKFPS